MRMLFIATLPHEPFNTVARKGAVGQIMKKILDDANPEAVYFTEEDGHRAAYMVINVDDPSRVPAFAEPWFLHFQAACKFRIVMSPEDLQRAGVDELGEKWA
jgi:hypothetical protein